MPASKQKAISARIVAARSKSNLSQSEAAKTWGISKHTIQAWEQGKNEPRGLYLAKIEEILKAAGA